MTKPPSPHRTPNRLLDQKRTIRGFQRQNERLTAENTRLRRLLRDAGINFDPAAKGARDDR